DVGKGAADQFSVFEYGGHRVFLRRGCQGSTPPRGGGSRSPPSRNAGAVIARLLSAGPGGAQPSSARVALSSASSDRVSRASGGPIPGRGRSAAKTAGGSGNRRARRSRR